MKARQTTQKLTFNIKSSGDEESEMEINEKNVKDVMQANAMNQKHQDDLANLIHIMILKNKINSNNAFEIPLVDVKELSDFRNFDKCTSWKNFSSIIEADAKLYGFRVDCVFNDTYKVLGVLNRGQKERERDKNLDSDNSTTSSIKNFGKNNKKIKTNDGKQTKFIEMNHNNLNINNYNLEFDIDPLLEKNSAIFDEGSSLGLLIINLFIDKNLALNFNTFELEKTDKKSIQLTTCLYSKFEDIGIKKNINFSKFICPELFSTLESKNENFQSKLNYSQTDDLNLSTITSVSFEESFTENTRYDFEYEDQEVIEEIELLTKEISFSFEKSSMENSIENFQVSQLNLSLCEFDDSLIGNGNTNFLEFYQEKDQNNFWLGPELLKIKKNKILKEPKQEETSQENQKQLFLNKINFEEKGKPTYLRDHPINLNRFFEDKLIKQMDPLKNLFLLPVDLHLDASKLVNLFERPFFDKKYNTDNKIIGDIIEKDDMFINEESENNEKKENIIQTLIPICEVKTKVWSFINEKKKDIPKKEIDFSYIIKNKFEIFVEKNQACSIQTIFLSVLHLANENSLILQNTEEDGNKLQIIFAK